MAAIIAITAAAIFSAITYLVSCCAERRADQNRADFDRAMRAWARTF